MLNYINKRRKKGQSTLEYAVLIIIIIGALLSIQVYIKRGIQGRLKSATDDIGDQFSVGNQNVVKTHHVNSVTAEEFGGTLGQGVSQTRMINVEQTRDTMSSNVLNTTSEYWGN
jgi:hypothetical protein